MIITTRLSSLEIESRLLDIVARELGFKREKISARSSFLEDLGCDSLDLVNLIIPIESAFNVSLPFDTPSPLYKSIFTRQPFRISDIAEAIYLQQETAIPTRQAWISKRVKIPKSLITEVPFTQLDGVWLKDEKKLLESISDDGELPQFRRRSDGMRCVKIPTSTVKIGSDEAGALHDEQPAHQVHLTSFIIDAEPVSTTAYCRFLNTEHIHDSVYLQDWFELSTDDDRIAHLPIFNTSRNWKPYAGTEKRPIMLVSWYGANAYSLWANGVDWRSYRDDSMSFLPSEAQWEYAARGANQQFDTSGQRRMQFGQHISSATYTLETLPLADVNETLGISEFGLYHMAGNVWQWCRDWYDADFYQRPESGTPNPMNRTPTGVRSERGGSWVGPAELCRTSYRRGRPPECRGRCLGFRCISKMS